MAVALLQAQRPTDMTRAAVAFTTTLQVQRPGQQATAGIRFDFRRPDV
jgi:hypothetical protein